MIVNEREAAIVRQVFETYAHTQIGLDTIAQQLEDNTALLSKLRRPLNVIHGNDAS
jgi:hypothetical protein